MRIWNNADDQAAAIIAVLAYIVGQPSEAAFENEVKKCVADPQHKYSQQLFHDEGKIDVDEADLRKVVFLSPGSWNNSQEELRPILVQAPPRDTAGLEDDKHLLARCIISPDLKDPYPCPPAPSPCASPSSWKNKNHRAKAVAMFLRKLIGNDTERDLCIKDDSRALRKLEEFSGLKPDGGVKIILLKDGERDNVAGNSIVLEIPPRKTAESFLREAECCYKYWDNFKAK